MDSGRRERLQQATRNACAALTKGMTKTQLSARLAEVKAKITASTDRNGKPIKGLADRVAACREEVARLEGLGAK